MGTTDSANTPLCRILEPPSNWDTGTHAERVRDFVGTGTSISTYDESVCPGLTVLAAYYGNRRGHGPANDASPKRLRCLENEVVAAGGTLERTPAADPWPSEYDAAHRDIVKGNESVAEHVVSLCEQDATRVVVTSRGELLMAIFELANRGDATDGFLEKVRLRARKLLRDEFRGHYIPIALRLPDLCFRFLDEDVEQQKQLRRYRQQNRSRWDAVAEVIPRVVGDTRFT